VTFRVKKKEEEMREGNVERVRRNSRNIAGIDPKFVEDAEVCSYNDTLQSFAAVNAKFLDTYN
jgi:hypothetical protein